MEAGLAGLGRAGVALGSMVVVVSASPARWRRAWRAWAGPGWRSGRWWWWSRHRRHDGGGLGGLGPGRGGARVDGGGGLGIAGTMEAGLAGLGRAGVALGSMVVV